MTVVSGPRLVRAPRGRELTCRGWGQEAALRMLMNNLDPEVAERPDDLVVYGGTGRAARSWDAFDAIVRELRALADDETLLVASGKPVAVFRTHEWAPRVLIANSNLVGRWATWETFRELERAGLTMYGQMTAGSWIYIGSQGILQGTYETFAELARQHFGGTLRGRVVLTAGLGGMGGAQPLAVTLNDGVALCIEVDPERVRRRLETRYVDRVSEDLDEALAWAREAAADGRAESIALVGNAAELEPELVRRGERFDAVTDQTSAHDALNGYVPAGLSPGRGRRAARADPAAYVRRSMASMADHVRAMLALQGGRRGDLRLRQQHPRPGPGRGRQRRLRHPGLRAGVHPAAVLRGPRALPLGGPVGRPGRHRADGRGRPRPVPRRCGRAALDRARPRSGSPSRDCRRASAGSATGSGRGPAWPSTSSCAAAP